MARSSNVLPAPEGPCTAIHCPADERERGKFEVRSKIADLKDRRPGVNGGEHWFFSRHRRRARMLTNPSPNARTPRAVSRRRTLRRLRWELLIGGRGIYLKNLGDTLWALKPMSPEIGLWGFV